MGGIVIVVGIGITSSFISALAAGFMKSRKRGESNKNHPKHILKYD